MAHWWHQTVSRASPGSTSTSTPANLSAFRLSRRELRHLHWAIAHAILYRVGILSLEIGDGGGSNPFTTGHLNPWSPPVIEWGGSCAWRKPILIPKRVCQNAILLAEKWRGFGADECRHYPLLMALFGGNVSILRFLDLTPGINTAERSLGFEPRRGVGANIANGLCVDGSLFAGYRLHLDARWFSWRLPTGRMGWFFTCSMARSGTKCSTGLLIPPVMRRFPTVILTTANRRPLQHTSI